MMKMATGEGFPLRQGAGMGLDWFTVAKEASAAELPVYSPPRSFRVYGYIWEEEVRRWTSGLSMRQGTRLGGGRAPHPRGQPGTLLVHLRYSMGFFWSKNKFHEVSAQLDSVCVVVLSRQMS